MTGFDEILNAFEKALELERELGTRTVDCDRALLVPLPASPAAVPAAPVAPPAVRSAPAARPPSLPPAPPPPHAQVDFAFIAVTRPHGAAGELLEKMVAAMGYTMDSVAVVEAAAAATAMPAARVYVVLGRDAFKLFAPGRRAALGLWTSVGEIPTVVTYSPARILSYFGNDAAGLQQAKRQIWSDLKSALARIGKTPPPRGAAR